MKFAFGIENMNIPSESITKKLKDPNSTLDDLLKEEELLQELKSQNKDLINFFNKDRIKEMLNYITKEQEDDINKGYKYPFVCSQIFGLENETIMKYFFITNKEMQELENKKEENNINKEEDKKEEESNANKEEDKKEEEPKKEGEEPKTEGEEPKKEEAPKEENVENKEEQKKEEEKPEEKKEDEKPEEEKKEEEPKKEEEEEKKEENNEEENNEGNESEEKSEPESTENKIELIDYLFNNFFPEDESVKLNYVLCGYFSSLINNLLQINSLAFLKYIYLERNEFLNKMVEHSYRKSISDTLSKILHYENYLQNQEPLDEKTKEDMNDTRKYLFTDIFEKIDIDMDNEDLNSIFFFITGLFDIQNLAEEKPIFEEIINNKKIIKSIITKPFHDLNLVSCSDNEEDYDKLLNRRKNFATLVEMISFFLKNIKKLKLEIPTNTSESKITIKHTRISDELFTILKSLLQNNFIKKNENEKSQLQSFNDYQLKPLGEYKIKIIELLTQLVPYFKNISKFYDEILIEVEFFKNAIEYLLQYEWNNMYQESLLSLFKTLFDHADDHQDLQKHLIEEIKIFELIQTHTTLDTLEKFSFTQTADNTLSKEERVTLPIKRGFYSFFISLSYKLNTVMGGTPVNIEGGIPRQGSFAFMKRVPEEGDKKAAMDMLYGGFMDEQEDKKEEEKEEETFSYECMKEFINDNWREFFGLNIESVIKQYENKNWPKQEKTPFQKALDENNETDKEVDLLNMHNDNDRDKNLFENDNDDNFGDFGDAKGRRGGIYDNNEENNEEDKANPFYDTIDKDNFDFNDDKDNKENKENENIVGNFGNENDFDFGDDDNKDKEKKEENDENKEEKKEEQKEEKLEENKEENKKENKDENKEEIKEEKNEEKKEEDKTETKEENKEEKKEEHKEENKEENKIE